MIYCIYWEDGVYAYKKTEDKFLYLMINGKNVLEGKKAINCRYDYKNGVCEYTTENIFWDTINLNEE